MIVKIKCSYCGRKMTVDAYDMKEARYIKRAHKENSVKCYVCITKERMTCKICGEEVHPFDAHMFAEKWELGMVHEDCYNIARGNKITRV